VGDGAGVRFAAADSGTAFFVGLTDRGPIDEPVLVRSLADAVAKLGARQTYGLIYDALDVFFREGGSRAYVGRIVGPSPVNATVNLDDSDSADCLTVTAISPGAWGNNLSVVVAASGGNFTITVKESGTAVETSPALADNTEAIAWAAESNYIRISQVSANEPKAQTVSLTTGADDRSSVTSTEVANALALFGPDLGPGQVAYPGATDGTSHLAVAAHASANNRVALLDGSDTATAATITAQTATVRAAGDGRVAGLFAPWVVVPGVTQGTTRTVPPSALMAGLAARSDGATNNPNLALAGENGVSRYAVGLSQAAWSDTDRETLNDAGVNVILEKAGAIRCYGNRTCSNQVTERNWLAFNNARLAMFISSKASQVAEQYLFSQLDGRGIKVAEFAGDLQGLLLPLYQQGALFGATPEEAFSVDTSEGVNPPEQLAAGKLSASISVRMSPAAERVEINITKVAAEETI
jgi:hypothetical protein